MSSTLPLPVPDHVVVGTRATEALPLPPATWGAGQALDALAEARLALPLPEGDAAVVSCLTTVVLRLADLAVKVYPPGTDPAHLARTATALHGTRTALVPLWEPVVTTSGVVTVSPWLRADRPVGWAATGRLLRRFHDEHRGADLPRWDPLRRLDSQVLGLAEADALVLLDARAALLGALDGLATPLGEGVVHGDVSPHNVLRGSGAPVLIDLDFAARAPLEYDLGSAARRADSGEIDARTYVAFCRAYGWDVRTWEGRPLLDAVAELGGVAFRLWDDRRNGAALGWVADAVARWATPL